MNNLELLTQIIQKSPLNEDDSKRMIKFFSQAEDKELIPAIALFTSRPEFLEIINDNYQKKIITLNALDEKEWDNIIKEELKLLLKLDQKTV